jgi:hypothetical protein
MFGWLRTNRSRLAILPGSLFVVPPVSTTPKRSYSVEDFSDLINARLQQLEGTQEARQRYGSLLAVLRQQVDAYRQRKGHGK